jgi:hypothetical protein
VPAISSTINSVDIEFKRGVRNDVDLRLIAALEEVVRPGIPSLYLAGSIFVSSADDSHILPSRHAQRKAVDISRINGRHIKGTYGVDAAITDIVQRIQKSFDQVPGRRENFGPYFKHKSGKPYNVPGHDDHIHLSVD